jgi:uncharacterized oligopeptide transporter (OPT) family protein
LRELGWGTGLAALFGFLSGGLRLLGDAFNFWIPAGSVAFRVAAGFSPALLAAGYLMGAAAGIAVLAGLALCWGVVVPWLTAQASPAAGQALSELSTQLWGSKARFLGRASSASRRCGPWPRWPSPLSRRFATSLRSVAEGPVATKPTRTCRAAGC